MDVPIIDMESTGKTIKRLRKERGLSACDIYKPLGITNQALWRWETGTSLPTIDNLVALASVLNVKVDDILQIEER